MDTDQTTPQQILVRSNWTGEKKRFIHRWAREILAGIYGYTEADPYMPVKIEGLEDGFREKATVGQLAKVEKAR